MRIPHERLLSEFTRVLLKKGFAPDRAAACAGMFAGASLDGVSSHGLNRFPRFIEYVDRGLVKPDAEPVLVSSFGAVERWDGRLGPGNLNALAMTERAIALSGYYGLGCAAIGNTNHWMRAGTYALHAADSGRLAICWTNTTPNMPPWGSSEARLGNNPIAVSIPREGGHILFDSAMSMFSYGKLESYALGGKELPVDGGFDSSGAPTRDPGAIIESKRPLPIGYWKGSSLSLVLDLLAVCLSGGRSVRQIGGLETEYGLSQVFLCVDPGKLPDGQRIRAEIEETIGYLHSAAPDESGSRAAYPGERSFRTRGENLRLGVPVDESYWNAVLSL